MIKNDQRSVIVRSFIFPKYVEAYFIIVCFYHITYTFIKNLHSVMMIVKELLAQDRRNI